MSFSFVSPLFLWALPAASIPLILHFIFRTRAIEVDFSYIHFIKIASKKNVRYSKLKNILLLILRTLLILAVILLFARPLFFSRGASKDTSEARSFVILLDTSYSMGYNSGGGVFFNKAKDAVHDMLVGMGREDKAVLIAFSDRVEYASGRFTGDRQFLVEKLSEIKLSRNPTDIQPAVSLALDLMAGSQAQNNIMVVVSDMNRNAWAAAGSGWKLPETSLKVVLAYSKDTVDNVSVREMELTGLYHGESSEVRVSAVNFNSYPAKRDIDIYIDDVKRIQGSMELNGYEDKVKIFTMALPEASGVKAAAGIRNDDLPADDTYYLHKNIRGGVNVLLVDGDPKLATIKGETFFLKTALSSGPDSKGVNLSIVNSSEFDAGALPQNGVVFLCNVEKFSNEQISSLQRHLDGGGAVIFTSGDKIKKDNYDKLGPILPVEVIASRQADAGLRIKNEGPSKHEFAAGLDGYDYGKVVFGGYIASRPKFGARTVLALENSAPLLVEKEVGAGKSVFFSSSIDDDWTNFPLKPLYPVFLRQLVKFSAADSEGILKSRRFFAGERISQKDFAPASNISSVVLFEPDGRKADLNSLFRKNLDYELRMPGFYRVERAAGARKQTERFAVNLKALDKEGDYTKADYSRIEKLFKPRPVIRLEIDDNYADKFFNLTRGRELAGALFWIILFLLLAESLAANIGGKRRRDA